MRVTLVSRYPRVDTPAWKREVAERLADAGCELSVLYSRSRRRDEVEAGLKEFGAAGAVRRYARLRGARPTARPAPSAAPAQSLRAWAQARSAPVVQCVRLADPACLEALRNLRPDLLILMGADIVPASVLGIPRVGTINPHYGLLPAYRGMNVTEWSVFCGDPVGVTVHAVDPGIDTGDLLAQEEIPIEGGDTFETLRAKHQAVAARLLVASALALRDGTAERRPQRLEDGRQYYRMHPAVRAEAERRLAARAGALASAG
jgi:folate-dependent phosphoribosylglycinamide formyltransferase PurN